MLVGIGESNNQFCPMVFIDTHSHIFGDQFETELDAVMLRAERAGVEKVLVPNVDAATIPEVIQTIRQYPKALPMWGLHPCSVKEDWKTELEKIEAMISEFPPVAIGEIGLDFYWSKDFVDDQFAALEYQLELALKNRLPVSLHTRDATRETIDLVRPFAGKGLRGVFHCFSGTETEANEITEMGFCLGIGGTLTFKNNPLRNWVKNLPIGFLVLETDAPYLAPVPYRGKRNEPAYLVEVATELSNLLRMDPSEIGKLTSENARRIFGI